jgi:putative phosphoribosyl transferase
MGSVGPGSPEPVSIPASDLRLEGDLTIPAEARGIVLFAHGSGSSRHSPRNRHVARLLAEGGLGTLLLDLLTPAEEALDVRTASLRFDIALLARRVVDATDWLAQADRTGRMRIGYFGASTGAAAALVAAAERAEVVGAVVSRGGRPDLAPGALGRVAAPTLLIVGGNDEPVLDLNRVALARLRTEKRLEVVPGATHLFEEPGALEQVADLAGDWFRRWMAADGPEPSDRPR